MEKKDEKYYKEDLEGCPLEFEGELKEAMEFAMDKCDNFLNGLDVPIDIDKGLENIKGFYIELSDVGELMMKWKKLGVNNGEKK